MSIQNLHMRGSKLRTLSKVVVYEYSTFTYEGFKVKNVE